MDLVTRFAFAAAVLLVLAAAAAAQQTNRFDGYAIELNADNSIACSMRFVADETAKMTVQVFEAGTEGRTPAANISQCGGSRVSGNNVTASGEDKSFCFQGPAKVYEVKFSNGKTWLWPAVSSETGFYNVKDFRPVKRGTDGSLTPVEPADYTSTIKNAMVYLAARQGGVLRFPEGDYVVGTTDGNTRDASYDGITVPSGVTIEGVSGNFSTPATNLPNKRGASRVRLRHPDQTIFRLGNCTNFVTIKNLELLSNVALYGEARREQKGTVGIEARGIWPLNRADGWKTNNSSLFIRFEGLTFQEFETGLKVHNVNGEKCDPQKQFCNGWNFDYIKVDQSFFINNATGIYIDTGNTDWKITNTVFNGLASRAPGTGIYVRRGGMMLVEQSFGAGYDYGSLIGGPFIDVYYLGALTVINSGAERSQLSMRFAEGGGASSTVLTIVGSIFSDPMELNGRINLTSTGNLYTARTFRAGPNVKITSMGDKFCMDPLINPGGCLNDAGRTDNNPKFNDGHIMFQTGRMPEGKGADVIGRQPNFFGYDVEVADDKAQSSEPLVTARTANGDRTMLRLGSMGNNYDLSRDRNTGFLRITGSQPKPNSGIALNGPIQFDPNITFSDLVRYAQHNQTVGRPAVSDGAFVYCKDCRKDNAGICTQGRAGTDGAFAKRINSQWRCD